MSDSESLPENFRRYSRQIRFAGLGLEGQKKLAESRVLLVGCGALGSTIADTLVRAGVGFLRMVDRDIVDLSNLQRQSLYTEADVASGMPKSVVAKRVLEGINSDVELEAHVLDVTAENVETLAEDCHIILDGTDNFEIRFLLNDVAMKHNLPWIFGGCLGGDGQMMVVVPGETPCLHCLMPDGPPDSGTQPTCDSAGILGPIIKTIASLQAMEAIKILSGRKDKICRQLVVASLWDTEFRQLDISAMRTQHVCPTCQLREFSWLDGGMERQWSVLCGRNSVQVSPGSGVRLDLNLLAEKLTGLGSVKRNPFLLQFTVDGWELSVFPDGRAIISGTEDIALARKVYTQYVGL